MHFKVGVRWVHLVLKVVGVNALLRVWGDFQLKVMVLWSQFLACNKLLRWNGDSQEGSVS